MAGVRTLADGREKWIIMTTKPADPEAVTITELTAGVNLGDRATRTGTYIRATASDTFDDTTFNATSNSVAFGRSNWEAQIEPYLLLDPATGLPDPADNEVHDLFATKGATLWVWKRRGPLEGVEPTAADPYGLFEVSTDKAQDQIAQGGNMRDIIPLTVRQDWEGVVAAGA